MPITTKPIPEGIDLFAPRGRWRTRPPIADRIDASGDCWEWTGYLNTNGYGTVNIGNAPRLAHRVVWTVLVGPIPEGLELDHLCRVRHCVNPDHLEPVTNAENKRRGMGNQHIRKTHCTRGHPLSGENLVVLLDGRRNCRACKCANAKRNYWQRKWDAATG